MNVSNFVGVGIGIKLVNGRFKPKYNAKSKIVLGLFFILFLMFLVLFGYGIINLNIEFIIMPLIGMWGIGYMLLISPYLQKSNDYLIEFMDENTLNGFKLYYKNKLVNIEYCVDEKGLIYFKNNSNKKECVSYADGSRMTNLDKYRVINYFAKWLSDYNLLSSNVTMSLE